MHSRKVLYVKHPKLLLNTLYGCAHDSAIRSGLTLAMLASTCTAVPMHHQQNRQSVVRRMYKHMMGRQKHLSICNETT